MIYGVFLFGWLCGICCWYLLSCLLLVEFVDWVLL